MKCDKNKDAYWSIDEESQPLNCFNSPFDRFCFTRIHFGQIKSQDVFQQNEPCTVKFPRLNRNYRRCHHVLKNENECNTKAI